MQTVIESLEIIEANQETIDIAEKMKEAIEKRLVEKTGSHPDFEDQFQSSLTGLLKALNFAIATFEKTKKEEIFHENYDEIKNKKTLHDRIILISSNYSYILW